MLARIAVLAVAMSAGCATAPPTPPPPDSPELRDLDIEGARAVSAGLIRSRIATSGRSKLPYSAKRYFDSSILDTDLKRILRLYQARGFYHAKIAEVRVTPAGASAVNVRISIVEGEPVRVSDLTLEGLQPLAPDTQRRVLYDLPLKQGAVFTEEAYDATRQALGERLRNAGYAEAEVNGVVQVDVPRHSVGVAIGVEPGPRYRFGQIFVAGAVQVSRQTILDAALRGLQPERHYSDTALSSAQARVFDLGVFSTVRVTRGAPDRQEGTVPVVVSVREAPFHTLRLGGGFALDPTRQEIPRVTAEWTSRNFLGGLRRFTFSNELALVFVPTLFQGLANPLDRGIAGSSTVSLQQPRFPARDVDLTAALGVERGVDFGFTYDEARASVGLIWRLTRRLTLVPSYNFQVFKLSGEATAALSNISTTTATQEAVLDACARQNRLCRLAYLEQRITWDLRDNAVEPSRGGWLSIALQEGSTALGGTYRYLRLAPEARGYLPLGRHVLAARILAGFLLPASGETSSVLTRFYLGGTNTLRGFGNRELAPSVVVDCTASSCGNFVKQLIPVGGNGMLGATLELRLVLPAKFGLVFFLDAGEVQPHVADLHLSQLNYAVGVGLRYRTVFGPVRLDFGYRISNPQLSIVDTNDQPFQMRCGVQGNQGSYACITRYAFHFSIGEAF